jgi:predicted KAP-like P-loop ATPase
MNDYEKEILIEFADAVDRWQSKVPSRRAREMTLAERIQVFHEEYQRLMSEWAELPFFSSESDRIEAKLDFIRMEMEVMELLPYIVKVLHKRTTASEEAGE